MHGYRSLLRRACKVAARVVELSGELEPLAPIAEWARDEVNLVVTAMGVLKKPMVSLAARALVFGTTVTFVSAVERRRGVPLQGSIILLNPVLSLFDDRFLGAVIVHELLHAAGVRDESEAAARSERVAELRPDLSLSSADMKKVADPKLAKLLKKWTPWDLTFMEEFLLVLRMHPSALFVMVKEMMFLSDCLERVRMGAGEE